MKHVPVVVIGAGPTGVAAATLLAQYGVDSVVIERHQDIYPLPRAVHLDDEVHRILDALGVATQFRSVSQPGRGLRLVDRDLKVLAQFDRGVAEDGIPQASMFDQPDLERLLRTNLEKYPEVELMSGTELLGLEQDEAHVVVHAKDSRGNPIELTADYVLGCDGANSLVREAMGSRTCDLGFEQRWLVIDLKCSVQFDDWDGVHQVCDTHRAGTYMRIGPDRFRWEFQLQEGETPADFGSLAELRSLLDAWVGDVADKDLEIIRVVEYTFRAMVADRWRKGRMFILGDAAHLTPPFIGQGMGAGLRDAFNLSWKLADVIHGRRADALLDTYQAERKRHVRGLIRKAVLIGSAMTGGRRMATGLRRVILPRIHHLPGMRRLVLSSATPRLRRSALVRRRSAGSAAGSLVPQFFDEMLGARAGLLILGPVGQEDHALAGELGVVATCAEPTEASVSWFKALGASAVLVRPDRVVAATGGSSAAVRRRLPTVLRSAS